MTDFLSRLVEDLRGAVTDPQADPQRTVLVAAVAVVVLLILVVLLLLLMTDAPRRVRRVRRPSFSPLAKGLAIAGVLALAIGLLIAGDRVASSSGRCASCHQIGPAAASGKQDVHRKAPCVSCHSTPGVTGALLTRLNGLGNLVSHIQGAELPQTTTVENGACLRCHRNVAEGTITTKGIRIRHSDLLEAGARCTDCHASQGHGRAKAEFARQPSMDKCVTCHDGTKADATCSVCHAQGNESQRPVPEDYPKVHLAEQGTCRGCHSLETCQECHGLEMPHPEGFPTADGHAALAAFDGKEQLCYRCHQENDCRRCHQPFDAHGADWMERHKLSPRDTSANCRDCHKRFTQRVMCDLCHPEGGAPGSSETTPPTTAP